MAPDLDRNAVFNGRREWRDPRRARALWRSPQPSLTGLIHGARASGVVALVGERAGADEPRAPDAQRIEVAIGQTVERDVGFAMGLLCDDLTIARFELRASTPESNKFSVTGIKEGTTSCRVGTAPSRPSYVFEIRVVPRRAAR